MRDLLLDKDMDILKRTISSFVKEEVTTFEVSQRDYIKELSQEAIKYFKDKASATGLRSLGAKKDWGGAGLSLFSRTVIYEEAAQHRLGFYHPSGDAFGEEIPSFLERCTKDQIETYVKPAVQDGRGCFIALWEEHEDNNIQRLKSSAVKNGEEWILNGHKFYIQKFEQAGFGVILVNCTGRNSEGKPTLFIIEGTDPTAIKETILIDVQKAHHLSFKDVRIHDNRRIGDIGEGEILIKKWLAEAQILLSARCLGIAQRALQYAKDYSKIRITRGKPLSEFPSIQSMIAEGVVSLNAARVLVHDAAKKVDNRDSVGAVHAKMAKLFTTETTAKIIDDTFQIHGGAGFAGDLPFERWYKEIRLARLDLQKKETIIKEIASMYL